MYDIHSPNEPKEDWMVALMEKAAQRLPKERLWVNPEVNYLDSDRTVIGLGMSATFDHVYGLKSSLPCCAGYRSGSSRRG